MKTDNLAAVFVVSTILAAILSSVLVAHYAALGVADVPVATLDSSPEGERVIACDGTLCVYFLRVDRRLLEVERVFVFTVPAGAVRIDSLSQYCRQEHVSCATHPADMIYRPPKGGRDESL
jgi:hypothetical protein